MHKRERCVKNTSKLTGKTHCVNRTTESSQTIKLRPRCRSDDKSALKPKSTYKGLYIYSPEAKISTKKHPKRTLSAEFM